MTRIIQFAYNGQAVQFNEDGWFNATEAAGRFGKRPVDWLFQRDTVEYLAALAARLGNCGIVQQFNEIKELKGTSAVSRAKLLKLAKKTGYVKTKSGSQEIGGGTWLHPKLAVQFARWLDIDFSIWCDEQIDSLIRGTPNAPDRRLLRHEAASSFKAMNAVLQYSRQEQGKTCGRHHYINEARLVNWALSGEFKGLDRDSLTTAELDLLGKLEAFNTVQIGLGRSYEQRKALLELFASEWRKDHAPLLAA